MGQFVYAIGVTPDGPLKVGFTTDPTSRLSSVQVGNPDELRIWGLGRVTSQRPANPLTAKKVEGALHRLLRHKHIRGEWFAVTEAELAQLVKQTSWAGGNFTWKTQPSL